MFHALCRVGLCAALLGLLFVPGLGLGQDPRVPEVEDGAKYFSEKAITHANTVIARIKERHHKDLIIETVEKGPEQDKKDWARSRFNKYRTDGVYIVWSKNPRFFEIEIGNETKSQKYFTAEDSQKLAEVIRGTKGKGNDEMLAKTVDFVAARMDQHPEKKAAAGKKGGAAVQNVPAPPAPVQHNEPVDSPPAWVGWVCTIAVVLLVVWIVIAIIRAIVGMMGGGYGGGYGYGGGGYGYGGGGGGFFTGMLGGMFGSMAGMWMYNNMFGGHATYGPGGQVNWGGGGAGGGVGGGDGSEPYKGDTDTAAGAGAGGNCGGGDDAGGGAGAAKEDGDFGDKGGGDDAGGGDAGGGDDGGGGGGWFGGGGGGGDDAGGGGGWFGGGGDAGGGDSGGGGGGCGGGGGGGGGCGGGGCGGGGGGGGD